MDVYCRIYLPCYFFIFWFRWLIFCCISCLFVYFFFLLYSVNGKLINSSGAIFQEKALFAHMYIRTYIYIYIYMYIRPPLLVGHSKPFRRCCNIIWNYVGISCFLCSPFASVFFCLFLFAPVLGKCHENYLLFNFVSSCICLSASKCVFVVYS